jgi:hypothetical protein
MILDHLQGGRAEARVGTVVDREPGMLLKTIASSPLWAASC